MQYTKDNIQRQHPKTTSKDNIQRQHPRTPMLCQQQTPLYKEKIIKPVFGIINTFKQFIFLSHSYQIPHMIVNSQSQGIHKQ